MPRRALPVGTCIPVWVISSSSHYHEEALHHLTESKVVWIPAVCKKRYLLNRILTNLSSIRCHMMGHFRRPPTWLRLNVVEIIYPSNKVAGSWYIQIFHTILVCVLCNKRFYAAPSFLALGKLTLTFDLLSKALTLTIAKMWTRKDRVFIFHICSACDKTLQV